MGSDITDFDTSGLTPVTAYPYVMKPYDHQITALKKSCFLPEYGYLMEMGTGKTKVILDNIGILFLHGKIRAALILAPNSVYRNWFLREMPAHIPEEIKQKMRVFVYKDQKVKSLADYLDNNDILTFLLFNIEAFSTRKDLVAILSMYMDLCPTLMAVDESTMIRKWSANRTKNIIRLGTHAAYRRIATGLVSPNGPMDVFPQFQFLKHGAFGTTSKVAFKARYCKTIPIEIAGHKTDKVIGLRNQGELRYKMEKMSYRVTKDECLDLPDKIYSFWDSELDEVSREHYIRMNKEAIFEIEHEDPSQSFFVRSSNRINMIMRLQMITCGHIKDKEGRHLRFSWKRIEDTLEFLSTVQGSVVIWSTFIKDIEDLTHRIKKEYGEKSVVQFYGAVSLAGRDDAIDRFMTKKSPYIVLNPAAGRFGTTLTAGSVAYYYSNSYDWEHRAQSEDRIHRIGQVNHCMFVDANAPNTINFPMIKTLRSKLNLASAVMGDGFRSWLI